MTSLTDTELLSLTEVMRKMHEVAKTADWEELSRLDDRRRIILQNDKKSVQSTEMTEVETRVTGATANDSERAAMIREIEILDKTILASAQDARQKLLDENHELSAQVNAKNLYAQTSLIG